MGAGGTGAATETDVLVVGAGPCGLAAAIALGRAGLRALVMDRGPLCSSIVSYPLYTTFFSTAEKLAIGGVPFTVGAEKPTRRDALAYYRGVADHFGLALRLYEPVTRLERVDGGFLARSTGPAGEERRTRARAVVLATGYFGSPNLLGVPGEDLPHVSHLFREGHEGFGLDVVVVGGGNSAVDAALDLYRAKARVTVVHFGEGPDPNVKPWILPDFLNRVKEGSIAARWGSRVRAIEPDAVLVETPDGPARLPARRVWLTTGFTPSTALLEQLGVAVDRATGIPAHDPATMETDVPGVFVAGVLTAGHDANKVFIENGRDHGGRIAEALRAGGSGLGSGDAG